MYSIYNAYKFLIAHAYYIIYSHQYTFMNNINNNNNQNKINKSIKVLLNLYKFISYNIYLNN